MSLRSAIVALSAFFLAAPVHAAVVFTSELAPVTDMGGGSYSYTIDGWDGGGTVSGTFAGSDLDVDGQLNSFLGEITGFTMSYSGGTIVGPVTFGLGDLFGLVYDLDSGPLGDGLALGVEGIGATSGPSTFVYGPGPFDLCGTGVDCGYIEAASVPEPSSLALVLVPFGIYAATRRRRKV